MENPKHILQMFENISLEEMDSVKLLNRTDTKYVLNSTEFLELLPMLIEDYRILEIEGNRASRYKTTYYDSPEFEFYHMHQRGKKNRYKVRKRQYVDTKLSFLEIKHKNNKGRTIKHRKVIPTLENALHDKDKAYIEEISGLSQMLESKLTNEFQRVTLVHKELPERLTFDMNLTFVKDGEELVLETIVIAELKQEQMNRASTFARLVKKKLIRPKRISKYCIGVALLEENVKKNKIKEKLNTLKKLA